MQTIPSVRTEALNGPARRILEAANAERGGVSNMLRVMAQSDNALDGYLYFTRAMEGSSLDPVLSELIALTVAQVDRCEYSLAEHTERARSLGLQEEEILAAREGRVANKKTEAALRFARGLVRRNGEYDPAELRKLGYADRQIVDIVACVGLNVFANFFNGVARPDIDYRKVEMNVQVA
jgi:AhpD family alkylhydroperoxidase